MSKKETLHIYTRVSTTTQSEKGMSLQNQRERGIEVSKQLKMNCNIWNEGGKSSYNDDLYNRPILLKLMEGFEDGSVKYVYVTDIDRLSRKSTTWYIILSKLEKYNITLYVGSGNKYNLNDHYDKLMMNIISGVTQFDNSQRTQRFFQNKIRKFCDGYLLHGTVPFGYKKYEIGKGKKIKEHKENGKVVRKIFSLFSKGKTIKDIQMYLGKNNIRTPTGKISWMFSQIRLVLKNKIYIGETEFHDKKSGKVYSRTPYGFDKVGSELVENSYEQKVLRKINKLRKKGESYLSISRFLNRNNHKTKMGKKWSKENVYSLLKINRNVIGKFSINS